MSFESMERVKKWSRSTGNARLVLYGIADHDGDGGAWPSVATLAKFANASERTVQRALKELVDLGEVVVHRNGGGTHATPNDRRPNRYEIVLGPTTDGVTAMSPRRAVDKVSDGVTTLSPRGMTDQARRGDTVVADGVTPVSPEPPMNPPEASMHAGEVDGTSGGVAALRAAFGQHPKLSLVSFARLSADNVARLERLVDQHGAARLAAAASAAYFGAGSVVAFIADWEHMAVPVAVKPSGPRCDHGVVRGMELDSSADPSRRCPACEHDHPASLASSSTLPLASTGC